MPASQTVKALNGLEFTVEPDEEPDPVFFTDQSPGFEVTVRNNEAKYDFSKDSAFRWTIETGPREWVYTGELIFGPLDSGEEKTILMADPLLAHESHMTVGISTGGASSISGSDRRELKPGRVDEAMAAYSFTVWDRSHYEASVTQPKRLQKWIIIASFLVAASSIIQIALGVLTLLS